MYEKREVSVTEPNISTLARFLVGFGSTAMVVFAILLIFQSRITGCVGYGYSAGTFLASARRQPMAIMSTRHLPC